MDETFNGAPSDTGAANSIGNAGEEPASQLGHLVERLHAEVPTAVTSPVVHLIAGLCHMSLNAGHEPEIPDFRRASIELRFAEFSELSEEEFRTLQHEFEALVTSAYTTRSIPVPRYILQRIDPASRSNILAHEADHLRALPERARASARLIMTFAHTGSSNGIADDITGVALYDMSLVEPREHLRVMLAPEALSPPDVDSARSLLARIGDPGLTATAEADIANRRLVDFSSQM